MKHKLRHLQLILLWSASAFFLALFYFSLGVYFVDIQQAEALMEFPLVVAFVIALSVLFTIDYLTGAIKS